MDGWRWRDFARCIERTPTLVGWEMSSHVRLQCSGEHRKRGAIGSPYCLVVYIFLQLMGNCQIWQSYRIRWSNNLSHGVDPNQSQTVKPRHIWVYSYNLCFHSVLGWVTILKCTCVHMSNCPSVYNSQEGVWKWIIFINQTEVQI